MNDKSPLDIELDFSSDRFRLVELLGEGCWGKVYKAYDRRTGKEVALKFLIPSDIAKQQAQRQGLDLDDIVTRNQMLINESNSRVHSSYILSGEYYDQDKDNKDKIKDGFLVMPSINNFLDKIIGENENLRRFQNNGLELGEILEYMQSLAQGISDFHSKTRLAHGDIKPDNLAVVYKILEAATQRIEDRKVMINDFGRATVASGFEHPNGNRGFEFTRAPEVWGKDGHAKQESDIWAFGSLMYRMFTGEYILESELNNAKDPSKFMTELTPEAGNAIIKSKINANIPRPFRKFFSKCLDFQKYERYSNGKELVRGLEKTVRNLDWRTQLYDGAVTGLKWGMAPAMLVGLFMLGEIIGPAEVKEIQKPEVVILTDTYQNPRGDMFVQFGEFETLKVPMPNLVPIDDYRERLIRGNTKNKFVAYMANKYFESVGHRDLTDAQWNAYRSFRALSGQNPADHGGRTGIEVIAIVQSIKYGIRLAQTMNGRFDPEDACTIAVSGIEKYVQATRQLGRNFKDYQYAIGIDGPLIPPEEREIIKKWVTAMKYDQFTEKIDGFSGKPLE